jgi:hypothetical protein
LEKQDKGSKPGRDGHLRILVESRRMRPFLFLNSAPAGSLRARI